MRPFVVICHVETLVWLERKQCKAAVVWENLAVDSSFCYNIIGIGKEKGEAINVGYARFNAALYFGNRRSLVPDTRIKRLYTRNFTKKR